MPLPRPALLAMRCTRNDAPHDVVMGRQSLEVISGLHSQPACRITAKITRKPFGGIRRHGTPFLDDFVYACRGHSNRHGQGMDAHIKRREKILAQDFARVHGRMRLVGLVMVVIPG